MIGMAGLALVAGALIGCIGIGGVLLVPSLALAGTDVHEAIGASMFAFIFSGAIGTYLYAAKASIDWRSAASVGAGAMPGALAGALLASRLSGNLLLLLIGAAAILSAARSFLGRKAAAAGPRLLSAASLAAVGVAVGIGSAVTGTGGPVLLVPLLLWLRVPVLAAVGLGQTVQVPIAVLASAENLLAGHLDLRLGLLLGLGIAVGTAAGAQVAHALPGIVLTRLVAVVLLLVGALLLYRSGSQLM